MPSPSDIPPIEVTKHKSDDLVKLLPNADSDACALVFKAVADPFVGRLVYFRLYSGVIRTGTEVFNPRSGEVERVGRLVKMHAQRREEVSEIYAGDIGTTSRLKLTKTNHTLHEKEKRICKPQSDTIRMRKRKTEKKRKF